MGDAEQVAEDGHGQDEGEVLDHVHPPVGLDPVEEIVDDAPHVRAQRLDLACREAPLEDQPADARVVGRVGVDEALGEVEVGEDAELGPLLGGEVIHRPGEAALVRVGVDLEIRPQDVVVAGHDPAADRVAPVHRVVLAQLPQRLVRVGEERG